MNYLLTISLLMNISVALAAKDTQSADEKIVTKTYSEAIRRRESIVKEASDALQESHNALSYLEKGKKKEALKSLAKATGKLEILISRDKSLKLAPVAVTVETDELTSNLDTVKTVKKEAQKALEANDVQEARDLLAGLTSEARITVTSIPLVSYPPAMKQAAADIDKNNIDEAKATLAGAFTAVAIEEITYPIPVMKAEYFVEQAQRASSNKKAVDDEAVKVYAKAAKEELKLAEALGYGMKDSFNSVYTRIDELQKNPLKDDAFYEDLKEEFANLGPSSSVSRQAQEAE